MKGDFNLTNSKDFSRKPAVILKTRRRGALASARLSEALLEAVQGGAEALLQEQAGVRAVAAGNKRNCVFQWQAIAGQASSVWQDKWKHI